MKENKQKIKTLNDLRKLVREEVFFKENLVAPESNSEINPEKEISDKPETFKKPDEEPNIAEADKCLAQIRELLDWYFR